MEGDGQGQGRASKVRGAQPQNAAGPGGAARLLDAAFDEAHGVRRLSLPERDRREGDALLLGELQQLVGRVDSGREHEDERRRRHRVGQHGVQVEHLVSVRVRVLVLGLGLGLGFGARVRARMGLGLGLGLG